MFKRQFEQSAGRTTEIVVGLVTMLITLGFIALLCLLFLNIREVQPLLLGIALLGLPAFWFGRLSFRLLLNKANSQGGLLSATSLQFFSVLLGIASVVFIAVSIYTGEARAVIGSIGLGIGCYYGWFIGQKRRSSAKT